MEVFNDITTLSRKNVHIKDKEKLNKTIKNLAQGGIKKLQVVSDFDKTITKQHHNGVPHLSSFAMFSSIPSIAHNDEFQTTVGKLRRKYYPLEIDPHIPVKDKIKSMEEWWQLTEEAIRGLKVSQEDIQDICSVSKPTLRDGCQEFFASLNEENVPVLVFSAGCGDIVLTTLKYCNVYLPNVKVISNFLNIDDNDNNTIKGFKDKILHVFNKNEYALKNTDFYEDVKDRDNVIVLGDSLGDASMAEGMDHCQQVLKIGFLYDHIEDSLPEYMNTFDIVLIDDQTMDIPRAIFDYIRKNQQINN